MALTLEQQYMLSVLHNQYMYHAYWCSGDFRSQGISRHGIDHQKPEYAAQHQKISVTYSRLESHVYW